MTYPQQPGNWNDPDPASAPPGGAQDRMKIDDPSWPDPASGPGHPASGPGHPASGPGHPASGPGYPAGGQPAGGYVAPAAAYPPPGYFPYGYPQPNPPTNGMSIASMIVSIIGLVSLPCYGVGGVVIGAVGAILGHVGRRQVGERGESGDGMALAGIIVGWIAVALGVLVVGLFVSVFVLAVSSTPSGFNSGY